MVVNLIVNGKTIKSWNCKTFKCDPFGNFLIDGYNFGHHWNNMLSMRDYLTFPKDKFMGIEENMKFCHDEGYYAYLEVIDG